MTIPDLKSRLLLGPGPSPVSEDVLHAMAQDTLGHLDPQFLAIMDRVGDALRSVFGTSNTMTFPLSATGSAGMEAALANVVERGDTVIIGVNGAFGTRLAEMARRMGCEVIAVEAEWGRIVPPEALLDAHSRHPDSRLIAVVHAETSTGVWQPLEEVGEGLRGSETLFVVDTVTSLGGIPVEVDEVGIDVAYSGTQKCLGVPPGLAPMSFSEKALRRIQARSTACQSWYLDVSLIAGYLGEERRYHHTAPINSIYALLAGLKAIEAEGLEARYARHQEVGDRLKSELVDRGFTLFAEEGHRLPQLTSVLLPEGRAEGPLRKRLLEDYDIEVGGGLGPGKGKLWRIGLMGSGATHESVDRLLTAVDRVLT